jgi:hypothetical protein
MEASRGFSNVPILMILIILPKASEVIGSIVLPLYQGSSILSSSLESAEPPSTLDFEYELQTEH